MSTRSLLIESLEISETSADPLLEAMENSGIKIKEKPNYRVVKDSEEILEIARNFGYNEYQKKNKISKKLIWKGVVTMATESILLDALRIPARYADEVLEAMESKKKVKKLDVDFEIVDDPEEILRIAKNFGYSQKDKK